MSSQLIPVLIVPVKFLRYLLTIVTDGSEVTTLLPASATVSLRVSVSVLRVEQLGRNCPDALRLLLELPVEQSHFDLAALRLRNSGAVLGSRWGHKGGGGRLLRPQQEGRNGVWREKLQFCSFGFVIQCVLFRGPVPFLTGRGTLVSNLCRNVGTRGKAEQNLSSYQIYSLSSENKTKS